MTFSIQIIWLTTLPGQALPFILIDRSLDGHPNKVNAIFYVSQVCYHASTAGTEQTDQMSWFCGRITRSRMVTLAGRVSMNSTASAISSDSSPSRAAAFAAIAAGSE